VGTDKLATTPDTEKDTPTLIEVEKSSSEDKDQQQAVRLVKTSCGDAHNIGLDVDGAAYSLPSPLDFDPFPSSTQHKVVDVVCGKEHCLLLTEHGQGKQYLTVYLAVLNLLVLAQYSHGEEVREVNLAMEI
jgi:alpha-tubulin suppressor-like RCC1 family protein